jgi:hypothetical protein
MSLVRILGLVWTTEGARDNIVTSWTVFAAVFGLLDTGLADVPKAQRALSADSLEVLAEELSPTDDGVMPVLFRGSRAIP